MARCPSPQSSSLISVRKPWTREHDAVRLRWRGRGGRDWRRFAGRCFQLARCGTENERLLVHDEHADADARLLPKRFAVFRCRVLKNLNAFQGAVADPANLRIDIEDDRHPIAPQLFPRRGDGFRDRRPHAGRNQHNPLARAADRGDQEFVGDGLDGGHQRRELFMPGSRCEWPSGARRA